MSGEGEEEPAVKALSGPWERGTPEGFHPITNPWRQHSTRIGGLFLVLFLHSKVRNLSAICFGGGGKRTASCAKPSLAHFWLWSPYSTYVALNCDSFVWLPSTFNSSLVRVSFHSVAFYCLGQCLVFGKIVCVFDSPTDLSNSLFERIRLCQVKTSWPISVVMALKAGSELQRLVWLIFPPFKKVRLDPRGLASRLSDRADLADRSRLFQLPWWLHPEPHHNCFF